MSVGRAIRPRLNSRRERGRENRRGQPAARMRLAVAGGKIPGDRQGFGRPGAMDLKIERHTILDRETLAPILRTSNIPERAYDLRHVLE